MTARSSDNLKLLKNISFAKFGTYYAYKMKKQGAAFALVAILAFLGFPLYTFSMYMVSVSHAALQEATARVSLPQSIESQEIIEPLKSAFDMWKSVYSIAPMIWVLSIIGLFIVTYVIMHSCYRYISGKRFVDMDYSLPISDDTRFFGDLLAGLTIIVVPVLASIITALGFNAATDFNCTFAQENYGFRELLVLLPRMVWPELAALILFYVFSLMIAVCCSRTVEARTVPLTVNVTVPIILFCIIMMMETSFFGSSMAISTGDFAALTVTSPFGIILGAFSNYSASYVQIKTAADAGKLVFLTADEWVGVVIVTLLYAAVAYVLFKLRRSERVGTPYAYKPMRHIVPALVTASVVSVLLSIEYSASFGSGNLFEKTLFNSESMGWLVAIACISFVMFLVVEIVSGKGFKRFGFTLLRYVATLAGSFAVYFAVILAGDAIVENYIPSAAEVESVLVTHSQYSLNLSCGLDNPEDINEIIELHRESITERVKNSENGMSVIYELKNGQKIHRIYDPSNALSEKIARKLMEKGGLERSYWLQGTYSYYYDSASSYPTIVKLYDEMLENEVDFKGVSISRGDKTIPLDIDPRALYEAIILDARDARYDDYFNNTEKRGRGEVVFEYTTERDAYETFLAIPTYFKRTNELLAQSGVSFGIDLSEFGAAVLLRNQSRIAEDYKYRWVHSTGSEEAYAESVVIPMDSALFTELYGYGTTAPARVRADGSIDADWLVFLIYKDRVNHCYPLSQTLAQAGIPDYNEYGSNNSASEYGDTEVNGGEYELNSQLYWSTCVLRIPSEYSARAAEIYSALKN